MTVDPRSDLVARQYKKWQYPEPIENLETWLVDSWDWFDPSHFHRLFWPDRPYQAEMEILIAGCGTNQAPTFAYTNPAARITAIDISQESLDHGHYLKEKHGLKNLDIHLLPIEEVGALGRDFDLIVSSGVLHHMASPQAGMNALAEVLRPEGVAAIMLYARYGRIGVEIMQSVFRDLGLRQDDESLGLVHTGLEWLDPTHPARVYGNVAADLSFDAGVVDTFLHGRDVSFTVEGCIDLVENAGLVFQDWYHKTAYYPPVVAAPGNKFLAAVDALPERQRWSVMERLRNLTGCHLFTACRPERPASNYRVDFAAPNALDYVPMWRFRAGLNGTDFFRHGWTITLSASQATLAQQINGERSIREVSGLIIDSGAIGNTNRIDVERAALDLFEGLWRMDFIAVDLSRTVS